MITVKKITADDTITLRHLVLRNNMPKEESIFEGDYDDDTQHFGAFDKDILVGVLTYHLKKTNTFKVHPVYRLTGLAVLPEYQGKGIGKKLIEKSLQKIAKDKPAFVWCFARDFAVKFYEKMGFLLKIQEVIIPNIGSHRIMFKFVQPSEN